VLSQLLAALSDKSAALIVVLNALPLRLIYKHKAALPPSHAVNGKHSPLQWCDGEPAEGMTFQTLDYVLVKDGIETHR